MSPLDRRQFLALSTVGGSGLLAGCDSFTEQFGTQSTAQSLSNLPVTVRVRHAEELVAGVDNPVVVHVSGEDGGLFGGGEIHDPEIELQVDGARINRLLPGDFALDADRDENEASGEGVDSPWSSDRRATFAVTVVPEDDDGIDLSLSLSGRPSADAERRTGDLSRDLSTRSRPRGAVTREKLAAAADQRGRLAGALSSMLADRGFDSQMHERLQEAMLTVGVSSVHMLADEALGAVVGVTDVLDYVWTTVSLFGSPFDYLLDGLVPDRPESVTDEQIEDATFAPPFYSDFLAQAQGVVDEFDQLYETRAEPEVARAKASVLLAAVEGKARAEADAWRRGGSDDGRALRLLRNQVFALDGETFRQDAEAVGQWARHYEDVVDPGIELVWPRGGDQPSLRENLFVVQSATQNYPELANTGHTVHGLVEGLAARAQRLHEYATEGGLETAIETPGGTDTPTETATPTDPETPTGPATPMAPVTGDSLSFEGGTAGDGAPPAPWTLRSAAGTHEVTTDHATDGRYSYHMASYRSDLDTTAIDVDVTLTDVATVRLDAYVAAHNASWGDVKISLNGASNGEHIYRSLDNADADDGQHRVDADVSEYTGEHTLVLWVRGDGNDVYWDDVRFLDERGDRLPLSAVLPGVEEGDDDETSGDRVIVNAAANGGEASVSQETWHWREDLDVGPVGMIDQDTGTRWQVADQPEEIYATFTCRERARVTGDYLDIGGDGGGRDVTEYELHVRDDASEPWTLARTFSESVTDDGNGTISHDFHDDPIEGTQFRLVLTEHTPPDGCLSACGVGIWEYHLLGEFVGGGSSDDPVTPSGDALFRDDFEDDSYTDTWTVTEQDDETIEQRDGVLVHDSAFAYNDGGDMLTNETFDASGRVTISYRLRVVETDYWGVGVALRFDDGVVQFKEQRWGSRDQFEANIRGRNIENRQQHIGPLLSTTEWTEYRIVVDFDENRIVSAERGGETYDVDIDFADVASDTFQLEIGTGRGHQLRYDYVELSE